MAIPWFLAVSGRELESVQPLPEKIAWMACHFSAHDSGISHLPPALPAGSLLILNDRVPMAGHDPHRIGQQLIQTVETLDCSGVLLDFQRRDSEEAMRLATHLIPSLPCPVAISDLYAKEMDCPVFLSPCPHHVPLSDYLLPWKGRHLWLDLAMDMEQITLTKAGSRISPLPPGQAPAEGHREDHLHCHYSITTGLDAVQFTLWRTREDLEALAEEAEKLGTEVLAGLYCELGV